MHLILGTVICATVGLTGQTHGMVAPVASRNQPQVGAFEPPVASQAVPVFPPVRMMTCGSVHRLVSAVLREQSTSKCIASCSLIHLCKLDRIAFKPQLAKFPPVQQQLFQRTGKLQWGRLIEICSAVPGSPHTACS